MNDRELLELAAKAAGIEGIYFEEIRMIREFCFQKYTYIKTDISQWNPLTDDGDALRLAVNLGIEITPFLGSKRTEAYCLSSLEASQSEDHNQDSYAATRRAIVRAAAEIAKARTDEFGGRA